MEVGEPLEPGAVLLPWVPDECLADPLQDLLPVQDHLDQRTPSLWALFCLRHFMLLSHSQSCESQTWIVLIKLTGEFINKLQTWHGWRKLSNKTWVVNVFIIHLDIYLFFVPIISTDCWGQFVWISRLRVSCSPGLSPAARCRCRDLGREPWQVISVMSERRRHYGQPQGSLQLFEADSFFVDESCIMQPISNLVKKVKHNKCSNQNCIIGGLTNDQFWSFFQHRMESFVNILILSYVEYTKISK